MKHLAIKLRTCDHALALRRGGAIFFHLSSVVKVTVLCFCFFFFNFRPRLKWWRISPNKKIQIHLLTHQKIKADICYTMRLMVKVIVISHSVGSSRPPFSVPFLVNHSYSISESPCTCPQSLESGDPSVWRPSVELSDSHQWSVNPLEARIIPYFFLFVVSTQCLAHGQNWMFIKLNWMSGIRKDIFRLIN